MSEREISTEIDGKKYTGHYRLDGKGLLHVSYAGYSKSTHHRGPEDPAPLARILLRELVGEARRNERI